MLSQTIDDLERRFTSLEPQIHAFLPEQGRFERLRREAEALEAGFPDPAARPALFGLLLGVKDMFHARGFPTMAGARLPAGVLDGPESESVSLLKRKGVLIAGKTVTTEFAYFGPGPTRNPHNPDHTPGGSSSGSAAAVAAGLCDLALGTQTIGSVNRPSAYCGVVGFKPSYDRISRAGVIPLAGSLDHVGLFARSVALAQTAAAQLCRDWRPSERSTSPVLGVPSGPYLERATPEGLALFVRSLEALRRGGMQVREAPALADFEEVYDRHQLILAAEAAEVHRDWFSEFGALYHPKTRELILRGQGIAPAALAAALDQLVPFRDAVESLRAAHGIDAWVTPAAPGPAPRGLDSTGDPVMNLPWTQAGLPTISIPSGSSAAGLPVGVQLVGGWNADEALFAIARQVETAILAYNS